MRNPEIRPSEINQGTVKELIRHAEGETPLVRVIEDTHTGTAKAQFALRLSGVDYEGDNNNSTSTNNTGPCTSMRYISSILDGLKGSQSIEVLCSVTRKSVGGLQNEWKIVGTASETGKERSIKDAIGLFESVNVVLKTMKSEYQFTAVNDSHEFETDRDNYPWSTTIEPADNVTVLEKNRRPIGFLVPESVSQEEVSIVLPMQPRKHIQGYLDSLYCGAPARPKNVRLILSIAPIELDTTEQTAIERILNGLKTGRRIVRRTDGGKEEEFENQTQIAKSIALLEPWAKYPSGYRVHCRVDADKPIPESLLSMIGKDVFHDCRVCVRPTSIADQKEHTATADEKQSVSVINLSGCFHKTAVPVPLFPSAKTLAESGFRRQYGSIARTGTSDGILLGRCGSDAWSDSVCYPRGDRAKHCYIIGASGTGKSTLLYQMIMQDIKNGEGVTLIDPHGDLYTQVLGSIPTERWGDTVIVNPCDFEYAVGINFLECSNSPYQSVEMNFIINEMIRIIDRLYDLKVTGGPMFEAYMRNSIALLLEADQGSATLIDVPRIFEDDNFREALIKRCQNQLVTNFWTKQALRACGDASLSNIAPYITSKLNQFTTNALLRPIIGQPVSTINFRNILDEGKILLVNLSKGLVGELDTQLLGMLIIGKIFSSAMGRIAVPVEERRRMFLYVDEFQNFTTDTVAHLLSESRKFGICLTLANQNLSQLATGHGRNNVLDSVLGNVGTILMFRMGVLDVEKMQPYVKPSFTARDLQELPDFHAIARMLVHNFPQRPFVFNTVAMTEKAHSQNLPEDIMDILRKCYSKPTREVEQEITARLAGGIFDNNS
ncbi:MAG: type IV secretion system DNA-binding domain-containing protein [Spirochaetaceae bacterium]|nr:type IV secretion system DNA-binding domain-containing protein [Spirochaetaceae bacterium]